MTVLAATQSSMIMWLAVSASALVGTGIVGSSPHQSWTVAPVSHAGSSYSPPYSTLLAVPHPPSNASGGCGGMASTQSLNTTMGTSVIRSHVSSAWCTAPVSNYVLVTPVAVFALPLNGTIGAMQAKVQFRVSYLANWSMSLGTCQINSTSGDCLVGASFAEYAAIGLVIVGKTASVAQSTVWVAHPFNGTTWDHLCQSGSCTTTTTLGNLTGTAHGSSSVTLFLRHQLIAGANYELIIAIGATLSSIAYSTGSFLGASSGLALSQSISVTGITVR